MEKNDNWEELNAEAQAIQDRYEGWIIKKVLNHYGVIREHLYFTADSPALMADRTKIFFTLVDTDSGTEFSVIGDLDKHGEITAYRIEILEE